MQNTRNSILAKLVARQIFLDIYLLFNLPVIEMRARLGNPAARVWPGSSQ